MSLGVEISPFLILMSGGGIGIYAAAIALGKQSQAELLDRGLEVFVTRHRSLW